MATKSQKPGRPIGIDLGTTNCCVAVCHAQDKDKIEVIYNASGGYITPSYVAFTKGATLVGEQAIKQMIMSPKQCLFDSKRLIGKSYDDADVQAKLKQWENLFTLKRSANGEPVYSVEVDGQRKDYKPTLISAQLLRYLKEQAQRFVGEEFQVSQAVITVPAYFKESQRRATIDAARTAGLEVLQLLNEPTSAAFAYKLNKFTSQSKGRIVLVFDLGGGTFDVSLVQLEGNKVEVKATNGDMHLGGQDFTWKIVDHCLSAFEKEHQIKKDQVNPKDIARLRIACENAKIYLSGDEQYDEELYIKGQEVCLSVSRGEFDSLVEPDIARCMKIVKQVLADANITQEQVDDVVLAGGSSRIPAVKSALQQFFVGKALNEQINPDQAVAQGAARMAQFLHDHAKRGQMDPVEDPKEPKIINIVPIPLGVSIKGKQMNVIIEKNATLPATETRMYYTMNKNQHEAQIVVLEGDHEFSEDCTVLNKFDLKIVGAKKEEQAGIAVTFNVDENQILTVKAKIEGTNTERTVTVNRKHGFASYQEIMRAGQELDINSRATPQERETLRSVIKFDELLKHLSQELRFNVKLGLNTRQQRSVTNLVGDTQLWLMQNCQRGSQVVEQEYSNFVQKVRLLAKQHANKLLPEDTPNNTY